LAGILSFILEASLVADVPSSSVSSLSVLCRENQAVDGYSSFGHQMNSSVPCCPDTALARAIEDARTRANGHSDHFRDEGDE
jgi:hypothetical protein